MIGKGAIGKANNSVTLGNSSVTAVYASDDSGATLYAGGLNLGGTAVTTDAAELNYVDGVTSAIQTQLDAKQATLTAGSGITISSGTISASSSGGASELNDLSDVKIENSSYFIGSTPSSTSNAAYSVGIGTNALKSLTTGDRNTAIGMEVLETVTTGDENTAVGNQSLRYNTGENNTALGSNAMVNNTSADGNVAIGYYALANNTTGHSNTVIGYQAGTAGSSTVMVDKPRITAIGYQAGKNNKGGNNTFIGHTAQKQSSTPQGSNSTAIGYQATVAGSNAFQLGNSSVTSLTVGDGGTGVTIYAGQIAQASDERLKKLIKPLVSYGLSYINKLNPVTWNWKSDDSMDAGFIAQEVQELSKDSKDPYGLIRKFNNPYTDEETLTMDYGKLVVPLVKAVQELSDEIERLKSEIKDLESKLEN